MSQAIDILGGITAEHFLNEYWQKKPLLVRQALPEVAGLLEPSDVMELALDETVTARLIKQKDRDPNQWSVKSSPLIKGDFQKMPKRWTLLVQAVDHYSFDLAQLWKKFSFIPQWRRDDIMVSYAPEGGSVGKHFDYYDVFLVQGYGRRRWQLGQMCDAETALVAGQPLKLLTELDIHFDELLEPGDLLYVPPGLAHYGVAEDDCLTYSFGFRMPNIASMMDRVSDQFTEDPQFAVPVQDEARQLNSNIGEITQLEIARFKALFLEQLQQSTTFDDALMCLMSDPKYLDSLPEPEEIAFGDLVDILDQGYALQLEPASRLLYRLDADQMRFWGNGEALCISAEFAPLLKALADGDVLELDARFDENALSQVAELMNDAILMLLPPEDEMTASD